MPMLVWGFDIFHAERDGSSRAGGRNVGDAPGSWSRVYNFQVTFPNSSQPTRASVSRAAFCVPVQGAGDYYGISECMPHDTNPVDPRKLSRSITITATMRRRGSALLDGARSAVPK